jgi:hypothetical protein
VSAAAAVRLDAVRARALTRELQTALDLAVGLVGQLWEGEGWRALGHSSWSAYCAAELPQLAVIVRGMPKPEQRAKVAELRGRGMSLRSVSELTGLAPNTVRAHAAAEGVVLADVLSLDGARRPAAAAVPKQRRPRVPTTDRLVVVVAAAGPDGLTVREVCQRARLPREVVAPALTRLAAAGRVDYRRPARRGLFGTYAGRIEQ